MKLSPIILSAAVAASSGQYLQTASGSRRLEHSRPVYQPPHQQSQSTVGELSTEYFLQPVTNTRHRTDSDLMRNHQQHGTGTSSSVQANVVSVTGTINRGLATYQRPGSSGSAGQSSPDDPRIGPSPHQPLLRQQPWALPLAALSAAAMLLMAGFEIFVLLKARAAAPSRRHLFLGQALLLGLFLLAGLSAAASLTANPISCAAFRLVGLPAALVFAALLVKCVFLLSLNSGVYLPAPYQALVLVFAVLVQVAIVGQWLYGEPPAVIQPTLQLRLDRSPTITSCKTPLGQTIASLGYPGALLVAVTCLAIRARGVRDNYREAAFIGLAVGLALPIWTTSTIGSIVATESEREAWLAYGLLATAILIFLAMFVPKGRQLAALGREGTNGVVTAATMRAEREERLSSLPGSGYSPSFFHFKPAESSLKRKMHYHSADRVALVSSGMPGCNACRHGGSPVYSEGTSGSNFEHMPYIHGPMETFVLPPGMYLRPEDTGNLYTTLSANPNVFFRELIQE